MSAVLAAAPAVAAAAPVSPPAVAPSSPAPQPAPQPVYQAVDFGRIVADLPVGQQWLDLEAGPLCIREGGESAFGGREAVPIPGAPETFRREIERAGLKTTVDDDLFGPPDTAGADFVISGVILALHARVCIPNVYAPSRQKGDISMEVEWRLYSKGRKEVVATVRTSVNDTIDAQPEGARVLLDYAFSDAVDEMAADPVIRQALAARAAASGPDALLPTAQAPIALPGSLGAAPHGVDAEAESVVLIAVSDGHGSGFLVSRDGYVLTDAHVVGDAKTVTVRWSDGVETAGQVVRVAKARDVALVKTDPRGHAPLPLRKDMPARGDTVFAIGAPLDPALQGTVTRGIISAHRVIDGFDLLQADVNTNRGMSGGPLLDDNGRVVALVESAMMAKGFAPEGINYFTPVGDALRYLSLTPQ